MSRPDRPTDVRNGPDWAKTRVSTRPTAPQDEEDTVGWSDVPVGHVHSTLAGPGSCTRQGCRPSRGLPGDVSQDEGTPRRDLGTWGPSSRGTTPSLHPVTPRTRGVVRGSVRPGAGRQVGVPTVHTARRHVPTRRRGPRTVDVAPTHGARVVSPTVTHTWSRAPVGHTWSLPLGDRVSGAVGGP